MTMKIPIILGIVACAACFFMSCGQTPSPPPSAEELAARQRALDEVAKQYIMLEHASLAEATGLLEHKDHRVRARAAKRLGELQSDAGNGDATDHLVAALADAHRRVRIEAATSLGQFRSENTVEPLIKLLADPDRKVRLYAFKALKKYGDSVIPVMISHLANSSPMKDMGYTDEAGKNQSIRVIIRKRLTLIGKPAVPFLIKGLEHEDPRAQSNSVTTLGEIGPDAAEALPHLIDILVGDKDHAMRKYAAHAIGSIGDLDPGVVPALQAALEDNNQAVVKEAKRSIKEIEDAAKKTRSAKKNKKSKAEKKAAIIEASKPTSRDTTHKDITRPRSTKEKPTE
jgi:HEAT repeat protein